MVSYNTCFRRVRVYCTETEKDIPIQGDKSSTGSEDSLLVRKCFQPSSHSYSQEGVEGSVPETAVPNSLNTKSHLNQS